MSKKDYIDAVNEIEVRKGLENEVIKKAKEGKGKRKYNIIYPISSLIVMCAVVLSVLIIPKKTIEKKPEDINQNAQKLETVGEFENLYALLKEKSVYTNNGYILDDFVKSTETNEEKGKTDYSKTNIQVEGVDEADIVKTDGKYIYYLANNEISIIEAKTMELAGKIELEKMYKGIEVFLKGDKIVVIATIYKYNNEKTEDYLYYYSNQYTTAFVYNVENKKDIKLERTVEIEGNYLNSRMIGGQVYLLSNKYINSYLCSQYNIEELKEEEFKPKYIDSAISNEIQNINFDCIYYMPDFEETTYLNIAAFNIENNEKAQIDSYLGAGDDIYASNTNLYVANSKHKYSELLGSYTETTEIFKFSLKDGKCEFIKSGEVPGTVLNQFSMDENNGYFRIATTDNSYWISDNKTNNIYVLNNDLEIVGKVEDLAKGERIYSVRFIGNRAYMVTFVQTDPLFVIDLSEPTNPKVLGELKIPGFSTYLHPYDETHLIGFGQNTEVVNYGYGDVVTTAGMKMALFDVTDPENPKEMYKIDIGEKGTYSSLLNNHKALLFSKEKNIIAFPISITENNYKVTFQGAIVYGLDLEKGFEEKGRITHYKQDIDKYYYNNGVERIIYINDNLYTLSRNQVKSTNMQTMEETGKLGL